MAKAQTELRISVPNCKQFFIRLHNTDLTRILSAQIFKQRILSQVMLRVAAALSVVS
jgi:hypothetical protein